MVSFKLRQVVVGEDEDGEDMTSCVVDLCEAPAGKGKPGKGQKLSANHKLALDALDAALISHGKTDYLADAPLGTMHVHAEHWKAELLRRGVLEKDHTNPWLQFKRLWQGLAGKSLIAHRGDSFWRVHESNSTGN